MKYLDGIKSEPKTELGVWLRWRNRIASDLRSMPGYGKKIQVLDEEDLYKRERAWHNQQMTKLYGKNWYRDQEEEL